jgi:hypothetical protein
MKPVHVFFALSAFAALLGLWRFSTMQEDSDKLRQRRSPIQTAPPSAEAAAPVESTMPFSTAAPLASSTADARLQAMEERLDELEKTVGDLADAWNRFAAAEDQKRRHASMRGWGPEQVTGAPDTPSAGDQPTAWASYAPDGGLEWLETSYERAVGVGQLRVLENTAVQRWRFGRVKSRVHRHRRTSGSPLAQVWWRARCGSISTRRKCRAGTKSTRWN